MGDQKDVNTIDIEKTPLNDTEWLTPEYLFNVIEGEFKPELQEEADNYVNAMDNRSENDTSDLLHTAYWNILTRYLLKPEITRGNKRKFNSFEEISTELPNVVEYSKIFNFKPFSETEMFEFASEKVIPVYDIVMIMNAPSQEIRDHLIRRLVSTDEYEKDSFMLSMVAKEALNRYIEECKEALEFLNQK